jgi:hypothetical protein
MIRSLPGVPRVFFACISAHRPQQVKPMEDAFGPMTWYVPEDEVHSYRSHHAKSIVPTTSLSQARNAALNDAFERDSHHALRRCLSLRLARDGFRLPEDAGRLSVIEAGGLLIEKWGDEDFSRRQEMESSDEGREGRG